MNKKLNASERQRIAKLAIEFFALETALNKSRLVSNQLQQTDYKNSQLATDQNEFNRLAGLRLSSIRKEIKSILKLS